MKNGRHGFPPSILIESFLGLSWLVMACPKAGFGIFGPPAAQLRLPVQEQRIAPAGKSLGFMERFQRTFSENFRKPSSIPPKWMSSGFDFAEFYPPVN
jgi:hypothetical protein